jgi:hypothetical protein
VAVVIILVLVVVSRHLEHTLLRSLVEYDLPKQSLQPIQHTRVHVVHVMGHKAVRLTPLTLTFILPLLRVETGIVSGLQHEMNNQRRQKPWDHTLERENATESPTPVRRQNHA